MSPYVDILKVIHILSAVLMAWPFYALVAVNQRIKLGPPLGDRTDIYVENIIKNRTIPCYVFQASALISGILLMLAGGGGWQSLITFPLMGIKLGLLVVVAATLTTVFISIQPRLDALFAQGGTPPFPAEIAAEIGKLRTTRKNRATVCLFCVLTIVMFGVQVWAPFPLWLNITLILAIAAFTRRAATSEIPYGWF